MTFFCDRVGFRIVDCADQGDPFRLDFAVLTFALGFDDRAFDLDRAAGGQFDDLRFIVRQI